MTANILAVAARTRVAYIAEATIGTTPDTPTFQELRRTNGNLGTKKTTVVSDEMHLDRNVRDEYQVGQDVTGSYDFEFSNGTLDDFLAASVQGTWSTNTLVNGTTEQSFTFEETQDLGASFAYNRFIGCEIDKLDLTLAARAAVKGTVSIMGLQETTASAIVTGATYTAANTNEIETAVSFAGLTVESLSPAPRIKQLSLSIANNLRTRDKLGSLYTDSLGAGQLDVTGSFDAYFDSEALYAAVLAHGKGQLEFTFGGTSGSRYTVNMPNIVFLDGSRKLGGKSNDVMVTVPFRALYASGISGTLQVLRNVT